MTDREAKAIHAAADAGEKRTFDAIQREILKQDRILAGGDPAATTAITTALVPDTEELVGGSGAAQSAQAND